ncbi:MAG: SWIM zinc finger family protein, partial [Acidobacteriota bacterium]|nr:SWIM zinc finger family protein [Acidobacteriota bacterium]
MPKEKLPKLTEAQIRALASAKSFERGQSYYQDGALVEPLRQGLELRAECAGSEYEPYQISVTLNAKGIAETSCTCPYDWGGICKHIVALLLAYVHNPQAIRIIEPLDQMLAGKSKADLIAIIQDLLRHQPNLISVVELTTQAQELKPGQPMNVSSYRTQARRALQHESSRSVERELKTLGETAARLARGGDVLNAGAIYHALLDETVKGYDDMISSMDEDGDIATIIDEFAKGLGKCLAQSAAETETRREWFESLLRAEIADIALGGIDLA